MKKTNIVGRQQIRAQDVQRLNEYLEQAFGYILEDYFQASTGVITGLAVSQSGASGLTVSIGGILTNDASGTMVFGEIEGASGLTVSLPSGGVRTDLVVAQYTTVNDTLGDNYYIADVTTRLEELRTMSQRTIGIASISVLQNTTYAGTPAGYIPLAEVAMSTSTITGVTDVRVFSRLQRLQQDFQQDFYGLFYAGM